MARSFTRRTHHPSPYKPPTFHPSNLIAAGATSARSTSPNGTGPSSSASAKMSRNEDLSAPPVGENRRDAPGGVPRSRTPPSMSSWKPTVGSSACARAAAPRSVDEAAVRALRVLYAPHPLVWLAPFPALDRLVVHTFPSYRPPRRLHAIAGFCESGLLRPEWRTGDEWVIEDSAPSPTRIPDFHYLRGNLGYRPVDQGATLAA